MIGGAVMAGMTDPNRIWTEAADRLKAEIGDGPFSSYIAPSAVRVDSQGNLILVTPTAYARDWVRKNALRRMNELWLGLDGLSRRLEVRCRAEMGSAPPSGLRDAPRLASISPAPIAPAAAAPAFAAATDGARAVRAAGLQERLTFDSFVEGHGNAFALAIAKQVATWADGHFNPVFFCGPYGYGKTHLLNAIAWEAQRLRPDAKVVYLTAERFLSTFVRAMQDRSTAAFKESLRSADMLLLDDVQFVGGKTSTQEELLNTLTALIEDGKRIVLSADRAPMALTDVEPRLRSHLAAGLTCPVEAADRDLKVAVAQSRLNALAQLGVVTGEARADVLEHLIDRTPGSMRELEGAVNTLAAVAGSRLSALTVDEVQSLLGHTHASREDSALLQFRMDNGVIAHITTNWVTPYKTRVLQVATKSRFIVADLITRQVTEFFGQQPDGSYSTRMLNAWPAEPLKKEHEAFIHAIRTGETAAVSGEDGLRNLEVALRCLGA